MDGMIAILVGGNVAAIDDIDNATTHKSELADYVKFVRELETTVSAEVPVGNGIEWTVKIPKR